MISAEHEHFLEDVALDEDLVALLVETEKSHELEGHDQHILLDRQPSVQRVEDAGKETRVYILANLLVEVVEHVSVELDAAEENGVDHLFKFRLVSSTPVVFKDQVFQAFFKDV